MCHLLICLMSQDSQRFMGCLSHAYLKCPPRCRSLDHLADVVDSISRRPLIDHQMYMPKVQFPRNSLEVLIKSGASLEPSTRSMVRRVLGK
jgi:hypothetical protein